MLGGVPLFFQVSCANGLGHSVRKTRDLAVFPFAKMKVINSKAFMVCFGERLLVELDDTLHIWHSGLQRCRELGAIGGASLFDRCSNQHDRVISLCGRDKCQHGWIAFTDTGSKCRRTWIAVFSR